MIRIGFLIPYSGVHTTIGDELESGFSTGIQDLLPGDSMSCFSEFIKTGHPDDIEKAVIKLYQYHRVDIVIGVIGSKVIRRLINVIERFKKPLFIMNLGGDVPRDDAQSPYLFYNSMHCWQSSFALGQWAQNKWGGMPGTALSSYESGYDLHYAFQAGITLAGAKELRKTMLPYQAHQYNTDLVIKEWEQHELSHGHAILSGTEGNQFLELFMNSDLHVRLPLTINYYAVEENTQVQAGLTSLPVPVYCATSWNKNSGDNANVKFIKQYEAYSEASPGVYALLSYEIGLVIQQVLQEQQQNKITSDTLAIISNINAEGPRGNISMGTTSLQLTNQVFIQKVSIENGAWIHEIQETVEGINWNSHLLDKQQLVVAGWQNPYLCV